MKIDIFHPEKTYDVIYADPPWRYNDQNCKGNCKQHYPTMKLEDLKALPIENLSSDNSILFMWVTMPLLDKAFEVMKAWGYKYKTCGFVWFKRTKNGKIHFGLGHYTRGNAELCLIGLKGKKPTFCTRSISQIVESEIREHSRKPDEVREKILELMGEKSCIELFARQSVPYWDCWGNEV